MSPCDTQRDGWGCRMCTRCRRSPSIVDWTADDAVSSMCVIGVCRAWCGCGGQEALGQGGGWPRALLELAENIQA